MNIQSTPRLVPTGASKSELWFSGEFPPISVIGNEAIRDSLDPVCLQQAINCRRAPGVTDVFVNPDAHLGYGAPTGSVIVSPSFLYPGSVGVDIKCSMSLIQFDVPALEIADHRTRRELLSAVNRRVPTGIGKNRKKGRNVRRIDKRLGEQIVVEGASQYVLTQLGIPNEWSARCEDSAHLGHDGTSDSLRKRLGQLNDLRQLSGFSEKINQLGTLGGGNHFGECEVVQIGGDAKSQTVAEAFGLQDECVAFLSHCGSRGFGHKLASQQLKLLNEHFNAWRIPFPSGDAQLVYAPLGSQLANDYLDDMALAANFATINHLLINAMVHEAFQEVLPGSQSQLIYFISHNIARQEILGGEKVWVHRKGATRAFPAGHQELIGTAFERTGHPILLPGNPRDGSVVMVAEEGAAQNGFSVNHGAGRCLSRKQAIKQLRQLDVDEDFERYDILTNCRTYPLDEAPEAYKKFADVTASVEEAGLASEVARLKAMFVIKDGEPND
jgi:tRNA-splicing ligase RtcB